MADPLRPDGPVKLDYAGPRVPEAASGPPRGRGPLVAAILAGLALGGLLWLVSGGGLGRMEIGMLVLPSSIPCVAVAAGALVRCLVLLGRPRTKPDLLFLAFVAAIGAITLFVALYLAMGQAMAEYSARSLS